jgi:polar amino acid transport system permease protein
MRYIVLPQALPAIIPALGNETIGMLKTSSLVAVISFNELLMGVQTIYFRNGAIIELLFVAAFWYLIIVSVTSIVQFFIERSLAKSRSSSRRRGAGIEFLRKAGVLKR